MPEQTLQILLVSKADSVLSPMEASEGVSGVECNMQPLVIRDFKFLDRVNNNKIKTEKMT